MKPKGSSGNQPPLDPQGPAGSLERFVRRFWPHLIMGLLPVAVLGPALTGGYVLRYDMVFTPEVHLRLSALARGEIFAHALPLQVLLKLMGVILPMHIVQKGVLLAVLALPALAMYRATRPYPSSARLLAGLLYAYNPFVYDRLMAGHWRFLLAYALTPLVVRAFYNLLHHPGRKPVIVAALWWTAVVYISVHHLVLLGVLFGVLAVATVRSRRQLLAAASLSVAVVVLNSWWIFMLSATANHTDGFSVDQFAAFATRHNPDYGLLAHMLSLHGFWHEGWPTLASTSRFWPVLALLWLLPALVGLAVSFRKRPFDRHFIAALLVASAASLFLAASVAPLVADINLWLFQHIPGLSGMREPQKFLAIVAFSYAYLAVFGFHAVMGLRRRRLRIVLVAAWLLTAGILNAPMWWGAGGRLKPTNYPLSWAAARSEMRKRPECRGLVLPWSQYITGSFTGTLTANPARQYFGDQVIASQHMRLPRVTEWESEESAAMTRALDARDPAALESVLRTHSVCFVLLVRSDGIGLYDWVYAMPVQQMELPDDNLEILVLTR